MGWHFATFFEEVVDHFGVLTKEFLCRCGIKGTQKFIYWYNVCRCCQWIATFSGNRAFYEELEVGNDRIFVDADSDEQKFEY